MVKKGIAIFKKGELKLLWSFYLYILFWTFSLMIQPYTFIYFRNLGFSYTQIASFTSVMMISLLVFEVPTGIVADLYGRKRSVIIGLVIVGASPLIIVFSSNYFIILFCYALIGLGITFFSGAEEAFIVDNLKFHGRDDLIKEYYIKMSSLMGLGTVVAFGLGSIIVRYYGIKPLWFMWGVGYLLSAFLLFFIKEYGFSPVVYNRVSLKHLMNPLLNSFAFIKHHHNFLNYLIGSSMVTILFVQSDLWNVFFVDKGINESNLSIIASITSLVIVFLPWFSRRVELKNIKKVLFVTTIIRIIILGAVFLIDRNNIIVGVILFIILGSIYSFEEPITSTYIQEETDSEIRATVGSFISMVYSVIGAIAGILIGILADFIGVKNSIIAFSLFGFISLYFYSKIHELDRS